MTPNHKIESLAETRESSEVFVNLIVLAKSASVRSTYWKRRITPAVPLRIGVCARLAMMCALIQAVAAPAAAQVVLPCGQSISSDGVDFERHIASILSREGCNSAACHGSFEGRGGLRLSLFGYSARQDFAALSEAKTGRVDTQSPLSSLVLRKPTGQDSHAGGKRFKVGSWQYRLLRTWIENGARWKQGSGAISRLVVNPRQVVLESEYHSTQLRVEAEFSDGTHFDVTSLCSFSSKNPAVCAVSDLGEISRQQPGDTFVVVSYRDGIRAVPVFVPFARDSDSLLEFPAEKNFIDRLVFSKLRRLGIQPASIADDTAFLRRASLDVIGALPEPDDVRQFVADEHPQKRMRKIEQLLGHPMRAAIWATRMCDITGCNIEQMEGPQELQSRRAKMWHDWFRERFTSNRPYDQVVHGVLCATSRDGLDVGEWMELESQLLRSAENGFSSKYAKRPTLDLYWRRTEEGGFPLEKVTELTSAAFLGIQIGCARCHKHPFDRWTQNDYNSFGNIFAPVKFDSSPELREQMTVLLDRQRTERTDSTSSPLYHLREVYVSPHGRRFHDTDTRRVITPRPLGGVPFEPSEDPRLQLFEWLMKRDNSYFAPSFVNRIWKKYFGTGLVEPVDAFSRSNPPTHPALLDALADELVRSGYDIRHIERQILNSSTYQLSSRSPQEVSPPNYSRAMIRPLLAEVAVDAIDFATGIRSDFGNDVPSGSLAIEIAPNILSKPEANALLSTFGRTDRMAACDCGRLEAPTLRQTLYRMSNAQLSDRLSGGRVAMLLEQDMSDREVVTELYLASLSRFPSETELETLTAHIARSPVRNDRVIDVAWALLNCREFLTNH